MQGWKNGEAKTLREGIKVNGRLTAKRGKVETKIKGCTFEKWSKGETVGAGAMGEELLRETKLTRDEHCWLRRAGRGLLWKNKSKSRNRKRRNRKQQR